jgi:hypothetical protein
MALKQGPPHIRRCCANGAIFFGWRNGIWVFVREVDEKILKKFRSATVSATCGWDKGKVMSRFLRGAEAGEHDVETQLGEVAGGQECPPTSAG